MDIYKLAPADKKLLAQKIGQDLIQHYGKKPHYEVGDIKDAMRRQNFPDTWEGWALSLYASPTDFATYHAKIGKDFDYLVMHGSMIEAITADTRESEFIHHDLAGTEEAWFSRYLDSLNNADSESPDVHRMDEDFTNRVSGESLEPVDTPYPRASAFIPAMYPRSYCTPVFDRLACGFAALMASSAFLLKHSGGRHLGLGLADVLFTYVPLAFAAYLAYRAIAPKHVELTATSLTVRQLFSRTRVFQRTDIALCNLSYPRWGMCLAIMHRDPMVDAIVLGNLNGDDALWRWFSGIPGERNPR